MAESRAVPASAPRPFTQRTAVRVEELDDAVAHGIITAEQRDRLLTMPVAGAIPESAESRGQVNLVSVGYWAGSIAVLFALAWFMADRWKSLRPGGVLVVALLYAISFALASSFLQRLGYRFAASLLATLAVGMAPIVAWCLESLAGVWPSPVARRDLYIPDVIERARWIPIQLSMALAGLVALRKVRFGLLVLTVAVPMGIALVQLTPLLFDPELDFRLSAWMALFTGTLLLLAAWILDQRMPRRMPEQAEDFAGWTYLAAVGFLLVGMLGVLDASLLMRHLLPADVALLVAVGFLLRRRLFLVPATVLFVAWLIFLAHEVFPTAVGFMIVMLSVGALLILGTVLLQRRFPGAIARFTGEGATKPAPRWLGGAYAVFAALILVLTITAIPRTRAELAKMQDRRNKEFRGQVERQRVEARRARAGRSETPVPERP